jgi:uncharacterized protein (TIGR02246 family)
MKPSIAIIGAAALVLTTSGCKHHGRGGHADAAAVKDQIRASEKKWNDWFHDKAHRNADAASQFYTDDAFFVGPGVKGTSGIGAIKKAYTDGFKDSNFDISFAADKIHVASSGDLAASRGHFTETYTDPNTKQVKSISGSYLTVYQKQPDGSWKAAEDFAAADPTAS